MHQPAAGGRLVRAASPLKSVGKAVGYALAVPSLIRYRIRTALFGRDRAFSLTSEQVARIPGALGVYVRQAFYKTTMDYVGEDVHFAYMTVLSKPKARIGSRTVFGRFVTVGLVELGEGVLVADGAQIPSGRYQHIDDTTPQSGETATSPDEAHDTACTPDSPRLMRDQSLTFKRLNIGDGVWIGANAVVMADVGAHAVVGAGAVVVKPVEAGVKVVGVPARPLASSTARQPTCASQKAA